MHRLLSLLATHWPGDTELAAFFAGFQGDLGPAGHSLPLRLAGGLHALVLQRRDPGLAAVYPPHGASDAQLAAAVDAALHTHDAWLTDWARSPPQTNEVRRSVALRAGAQVAVARHPLPLQLSELGASGGLNLGWDRYAIWAGDRRFGPRRPVLELKPDWRGVPPPDADIRITERRGVDLNPLPPDDPAARLRLVAYLWPDQDARLTRTRAALEASEATVDRGDAIDWLEARLATPCPGRLHLIQHSVAWQYFPQDAQMRGQALIETAGAKASAEAPLAWLSMESDGDISGARGAALTLRLWPGDLRLELGRVDFHGRWVDWSG